ncbi:MAG TPA: hypothetical protein VEB62_02760 [Brevundimonas sp.]|nr:hypothetical protein [Brevundimonas sp.]HYC96858.1 hypothetical protein [Brevundimonas sp.]
MAQDDMGRTGGGHALGSDVLAFGRPVLRLGRKRDPELEALDPVRRSGRQLLAVPYPASRPHPFDAAVSDRPLAGVRIVKAQIASDQDGDGGYA